ncbi:hypothetical protein B0T17DRAFT_618241 [Bombardia bombarda]|uniref:Uncharacterized protein n=1 Tax=Bombardia bombarda TaxID=252184 RepID=A0AA39WUJ2_9PEZI|nr:hypothetical protein B0T17DRAFT_618241 [Bombardia bombarda]
MAMRQTPVKMKQNLELLRIEQAQLDESRPVLILPYRFGPRPSEPSTTNPLPFTVLTAAENSRPLPTDNGSGSIPPARKPRGFEELKDFFGGIKRRQINPKRRPLASLPHQNRQASDYPYQEQPYHSRLYYSNPRMTPAATSSAIDRLIL